MSTARNASILYSIAWSREILGSRSIARCGEISLAPSLLKLCDFKDLFHSVPSFFYMLNIHTCIVDSMHLLSCTNTHTRTRTHTHILSL